VASARGRRAYNAAVTLLLAKLTLAPLLVVGSSLAGRRWGATVAGLLVALPIVAGPVLLIVAIEQGTHFAARAASTSLLGLAALAAFVAVFANVGRKGAWARALAAGWVTFIALALALSTIGVSRGTAFAIALCAFALAARLLPDDRRTAADRGGRLPAWDLPARALATAVLVVSLTGAASGLGARVTGVLTPFPVAMSVLAAFVLAQRGPREANALLRGFLHGAPGFAVFSLLVALLVVAAGPVAAFALALLCAVAVQLLVRSIERAWLARSRALA
jgi:hypothetical protein